MSCELFIILHGTLLLVLGACGASSSLNPCLSARCTSSLAWRHAWLATCCCAPPVAACLQLGELKSRITSFTARWHELKPKGVPSGDPALVLVKLGEYSRQLTELQVGPCHCHIVAVCQAERGSCLAGACLHTGESLFPALLKCQQYNAY